MKVNKNKFSFACLLCLAFFTAAGFFAGCSLFSDDSDDESSEIQLSQVSRLSFALASDSSRTILPQDVTENEINKVELTVNASGSSESVLNVEWASLSEMLQDTGRTLIAGTYDFFLSLYVGERVCQKAAITEKAVVPGENRLEFDAKYVADGKGNFSLKLRWQKDARVSKVIASFLELDGKTVLSGYSAEELTLSDESEYSTALYAKSDVPSGTYFVKFVLYSDDDAEMNTLVDIVKIVSCLNTTSTATLSNINTTYKITYNLNGGSISGSYATSFNENTAVLLPDYEKLTKSDYEFAGWYTDPSFSGDALSQIALGTKNDIVLYAKWKFPKISAESVASKISSLTESTTLVVTGEISTSTISKINSALKELKNKNSNVSVELDLSQTTGLTSIERYAFSGCSGLTSVEIPSSVKSIGFSAFYGCSGLTSVEIPASVTRIGDGAFYGCSGLTSVKYGGTIEQWLKISFASYSANPLSNAHHLYIDGSEVTDFVIPASVTSIGDWAFSGCSELTSVEIPISVTSIGDGAFYGCSGLTSVEIPSSVTSIGDWAFSGCSGLTSVEIPSGVTSIERYAFSGCSGLTSVEIPISVTSIGDGAFSGCSGLTSVEIPSGVTSIGDGAFSGCSGLTSVEIPSGVTSIGDKAFYGCSGLTSVEIPSGVTSIGDKAFYGCSGLTSVEIPSGVTSIGEDAFSECSGLTSVTIPDSVTSIGHSAFRGCWRRLTSVKYGGTIEQWLKISFAGYDANPLYYAHHLYIGGSEVTDLVIPAGVTSIGKSAFSGCNGLTSVEIPSSVTSIGEYAFSDCCGLTSVEIPSGVTSIGDWAFSGCNGLTSVTIPSSVTSIGNYAFLLCSKLTNVTIPDSVTSIGNSAFDRCFGLTSVTIPDSVTSIGNSAFDRCFGLTSVKIPSSVTSIGDGAFSECSKITTINFAGTKSQWNSISKGTNWNANVPATKVVCADGEVEL